MRFRATDDNLEVSVGPEALGSLLASVYKALIPSHTRKLYVHVDTAQSIPEHPAVVRVTDESTPGNFLQSFRVIVRGSTATLVAARGSSFRKSAWRQLAAQLQASNYVSKPTAEGLSRRSDLAAGGGLTRR